MITTEEVKRRLWDGADTLRGSMDASRYKDYMLGLMFYKFLSDKTLLAYKNSAHLEGSSEELTISYTKKYQRYYEATGSRNNDLTDMLKMMLGGYCILPQYLYQQWLIDINNGNFQLQNVIDSLSDFERNIVGSEDAADFIGLFSGLDLTDTALGATLKNRSDNIKGLILLFADLNMIELQENDILGDAYEYLIGMFALESGKKAGEFYTPHYVSEVLARIVTASSKVASVYDPTVGSGSLLLTVSNHLTADEQLKLNYYGQELNTATYNLTRMNLLLHGIRPEKMEIRNGDTLAQDWPEDPARPGKGIMFDAIVMNPPYSAKNWNKSGLKISDPRFNEYSELPPAGKGDYAFLLHGLFHLATEGTMAILLPHGVLFRGASEGTIRQRLIEKNKIDAIIGLPANLFTNTGIPVIVMILKKNRKLDAPVVIIDASRDFIKEGKTNRLRERDIERIVDAYLRRREIPGFCHLATRNEIKENAYNLNIPRYIEAPQQELAQDVDAHLYGGIPCRDIQSLPVLNALVPDVLQAAFCPALDGEGKERPGYVELRITSDELSKSVMTDARVTDRMKALRSETEAYIKRYFDEITACCGGEAPHTAHELRLRMLEDMKAMLEAFPFADEYSGFQMIADLWRSSLAKDMRKILELGFYPASRLLEPNYITKGTGENRHEEQDGFIGAIVPNELVARTFFSHLLEQITAATNKAAEIDNELAELLESAKAEDTPEATALADVIDEEKDAFDKKKAAAALKAADRQSEEYRILQRLKGLYAEKTATGKQIKEAKSALKEAVEARIPTLTEAEAKALLLEKWFGSLPAQMEALLTAPLQAELDRISALQTLYADTLTELDLQIADMDAALAALQKELVITDGE